MCWGCVRRLDPPTHTHANTRSLSQAQHTRAHTYTLRHRRTHVYASIQYTCTKATAHWVRTHAHTHMSTHTYIRTHIRTHTLSFSLSPTHRQELAGSKSHAATLCNILQLTATHKKCRQIGITPRCNTLQHTATYCNAHLHAHR